SQATPDHSATGTPETTVVAVLGGSNPTGQSGATRPSSDAPTHTIAPVSSGAGPLGVRFSVLKRDPGGAFQEIDPDTAFRTGDAIRLEVETNSSGYLYVVNQGSSGMW